MGLVVFPSVFQRGAAFIDIMDGSERPSIEATLKKVPFALERILFISLSLMQLIRVILTFNDFIITIYEFYFDTSYYNGFLSHVKLLYNPFS
jgi:hypothetical protein